MAKKFDDADLMGAFHAGQFALAETQPTPRALDAAKAAAQHRKELQNENGS